MSDDIAAKRARVLAARKLCREHNLFPPPAGVQVYFLGGMNRIGGSNCALIEQPAESRQRGYQLALDCGADMGELSLEGVMSSRSLARLNMIDFSKLVGVLLTHGHYDHILSLSELVKRNWQATGRALVVYGSKITLIIAKRILQIAEVSENYYRPVEVETMKTHDLGNGFSALAFPVKHSIAGALGFVVSVCGKNICCPGDFKYTLKDNMSDFLETEALFQELSTMDIDLLLLDSSYIGTPGLTGTLTTVVDSFKQVFQPDNREFASKRLIVTSFSSNTDLIEEIGFLAIVLGKRQVEVVGPSIDFFWNNVVSERVRQRNVRTANPKLVFAAGSQGETGSALERASRGRNDYLSLTNDNVIFFCSRVIPGNERRFASMFDGLQRRVGRIVLPEDMPIYTSGHGYQEDLAGAVRDIAPAQVVGIHAGFRNRRQVLSLVNHDPELSENTLGIVADSAHYVPVII